MRVFLGGYATYAEALERDAEAAAEAARPAPKPSAKPEARPAVDKSKDKGKKKLRERVQALEREIEAAEDAVARLDWLAAEPDTAKDGDRMRELATERRTAADKVAALTEEWERASTELER